MKHLYWAIGGGVVGVVILIWLTAWVVVLLLPNPLQSSFSGRLPWPVACTTRGCVTTASWFATNQEAITFAQAFNQPAPTLADTLTTTLHKKLIADATLKSTVTLGDATKYRTQVLNLTDDQVIQNHTGLSPKDYDQDIVQPFLEQESLRAQRKIESPAELYHQLAAEHWLFMPLRTFRWDASAGQAVGR